MHPVNSGIHMKIYTKTGDRGLTSLLGGDRVLKSDIRIEAYGTIDELNSYLGLVASQAELGDFKDILKGIQDNLFVIGAELAGGDGSVKTNIPKVEETEIHLLEKSIDRMEADLKPIREFILPGGHPVVAHCHIARCICRRAERNTVALAQVQPVRDMIIVYLNRLSDYLFVMARSAAQKLGAEEVLWRSRKVG